MRAQLPEIVQAVVNGQPIEANEETKQVLIGLFFLHDFRDEVSDATRRRAGELLRELFHV
jgi:hypothetical protein